MLNKVVLIGRLGADPELKYAQGGGSAIVRLRVATDDSYVDREGQRVDRTEWHTVVAFNRLAENCNNFLGKGSLVYVEGSLTTRKWEDANGQPRYTTEVRAQRILFLDRKGEGHAPGDDNSGYGRGGGREGRRQAMDEEDRWENDPPAPQENQRSRQGRGQNGDSRQQKRPPRQDRDYGGSQGGSESGLDEVPF